MLTADDYGFHQGDVWYRAAYSGAGAASTLSMPTAGGGAGMLQAWLDGVYLGQNVLASGQAAPPTTGTATFTIPTALRTDGPHTLAVMVRDDGHNEDGGVNDAQKEGRGLIAVTMTDADQAAVTPQISWRIQGDLGGEQLADPVRGPENNGGLFGERHGWYLPGYPDGDWTQHDRAGDHGDVGHRVVPDHVRPEHPAARRRVARADDRRPLVAALGGGLPRADLRQRVEHGAVHRQRRAPSTRS